MAIETHIVFMWLTAYGANPLTQLDHDPVVLATFLSYISHRFVVDVYATAALPVVSRSLAPPSCDIMIRDKACIRSGRQHEAGGKAESIDILDSHVITAHPSEGRLCIVPHKRAH